MKKTRLAVIGLHHGKYHARSIKSIDAELVGICARTPSYADLAAEWKTAFYTDYREMLDREKPDGVVVAVPPHMRTDMILDCIERGTSVLVEKPFANDMETADRIIAAAERSKVKLLVGHQHRFDPGVELTKEMTLQDAAGRLVGFHVFAVYPKANEYFKDAWRTKRATGGGPLMANAIHDIDRIRYICGDIEAVTAMMSNASRGSEVEDTVAVSIRCKNGAVGTYYLSDCSHPLTEYTDYYYFRKASACFNCSSMYPTEGRHTFKQAVIEEVNRGYYDREKEETTKVIPSRNHYVRQMEHFVKVIAGDEAPRSSARDAKKSLQALFAILESAQRRETVTIESHGSI